MMSGSRQCDRIRFEKGAPLRETATVGQVGDPAKRGINLGLFQYPSPVPLLSGMGLLFRTRPPRRTETEFDTRWHRAPLSAMPGQIADAVNIGL